MKVSKFLFLSSLTFFFLPLSCSASKANLTCAYDPELTEEPNPFGMRAYLTITQEEEDTKFVFEQFPSNLDENVTISSRRELIMYNTKLDTARVIMLQNNSYYFELIGYQNPEGFAPVNAVLTCK